LTHGKSEAVAEEQESVWHYFKKFTDDKDSGMSSSSRIITSELPIVVMNDNTKEVIAELD
jgi:hypothetical protein